MDNAVLKPIHLMSKAGKITTRRRTSAYEPSPLRKQATHALGRQRDQPVFKQVFEAAPAGQSSDNSLPITHHHGRSRPGDGSDTGDGLDAARHGDEPGARGTSHAKGGNQAD